MIRCRDWLPRLNTVSNRIIPLTKMKNSISFHSLVLFSTSHIHTSRSPYPGLRISQTHSTFAWTRTSEFVDSTRGNSELVWATVAIYVLYESVKKKMSKQQLFHARHSLFSACIYYNEWHQTLNFYSHFWYFHTVIYTLSRKHTHIHTHTHHNNG